MHLLRISSPGGRAQPAPRYLCPRASAAPSYATISITHRVKNVLFSRRGAGDVVLSFPLLVTLASDFVALAHFVLVVDFTRFFLWTFGEAASFGARSFGQFSQFRFFSFLKRRIKRDFDQIEEVRFLKLNFFWSIEPI